MYPYQLRRFPPLREGNRVGRVGSVPPACRGNLKEGVIGHTRFWELRLRDWYDSHQTTIDSYQTTIDSYQTTMDSYQTTMDRRQVNQTAGECSRARRMGRMSHKVEARRAVPLRLISRVGVRLKGVGFLRACLLTALPSRAFLPPCKRDARAPSTRDAGNAGVPPAVPTAREKTYPSKPAGSPRFARGTEPRVHAVPPASN